MVFFFVVGWGLAGIKHKEESTALKDQLYFSMYMFSNFLIFTEAFDNPE